MTRYSSTMREALQKVREGRMKDRLTKAQDLMGPSKNREQGIEFVMKGLKVSKKEATKLVDAVLDMVMKNEYEIYEKLGKNADAGDYIDDFRKSDAPQFKGKSEKERDKMAIAAYLDAKDKKEALDKKDVKTVKGVIKGLKKAVATHSDQVKTLTKDIKDQKEEVELDEAKYDLYHKDFSSAMQHAYAMAKKLHGITIDPKEIDNKVATGPRKPGTGKTNTYRLKGDKGNIQIQVYNKGGSKPFELNMYKEEVELDELKMNDPKLVKKFDKLKRGDTVKLKTSSTISKGTDFVDYVVKAKNTVNKGRVEKITLVTKGNEKAVKKFLYKRDGKVTFAIGDMGASIDDIKEELDEGMKYTHVAVDKKGLVIGFASDEKDAKDMARRNDGKVVKLKKPMSDKKGDMMVNRPFKEEDEKKMDKPDSAKAVDQARDDKKKTRIAQLQLQIAKASEMINKLNSQEKPDA